MFPGTVDVRIVQTISSLSFYNLANSLKWWCSKWGLEGHLGPAGGGQGGEGGGLQGEGYQESAAVDSQVGFTKKFKEQRNKWTFRRGKFMWKFMLTFFGMGGDRTASKFANFYKFKESLSWSGYYYKVCSYSPFCWPSTSLACKGLRINY